MESVNMQVCDYCNEIETSWGLVLTKRGEVVPRRWAPSLSVTVQPEFCKEKRTEKWSTSHPIASQTDLCDREPRGADGENLLSGEERKPSSCSLSEHVQVEDDYSGKVLDPSVKYRRGKVREFTLSTIHHLCNKRGENNIKREVQKSTPIKQNMGELVLVSGC